MADFTAKDVKKLRDLTGAGMMDCKKALTESDGDFDAAAELLRVKGAAKAAKRGAERTASNGLVAEQDGTLIELNCETDFVAKGGDFAKLTADVLAAVVAAGAADRDAALAAKTADGKTVAELVEGAASVIGEKIELGRVVKFDGAVVTYMHKRASDLPAQVGVLVEYTGDADAARGAAMQIAAMRPQYLVREDVPAETVENERRIAEATSREEGKPEAALPKIVEGRVNGFFKDVVLLEQPSVQESKKSVQQVLEAAGTTVTRFARFEVGA
jgi:elongation factor Ts